MPKRSASLTRLLVVRGLRLLMPVSPLVLLACDRHLDRESARNPATDSLTFVYRIDGKVVSKAEAFAVADDQISEVNGTPVRPGVPGSILISLLAPGTRPALARSAGTAARSVRAAESTLVYAYEHPLAIVDEDAKRYPQLILVDGKAVSMEIAATITRGEIDQISYLSPDSAKKLSSEPNAARGAISATRKPKP